MASRLVLVDDAGESPICVAFHEHERDPRQVDVTASQALEDGGDLAAAHDRLEQAVRALLPFSERRIGRVAEAPRPEWDDELALGDPQGSGGGWPTEVEIRLPTRAPVFALPREELAGRRHDRRSPPQAGPGLKRGGARRRPRATGDGDGRGHLHASG
jgi:hypothetical protein